MKALPVDINWKPDMSIYASEPFLKAVGDEYGWLGGVDNSGALRCILPYTIIRKATVRMVRFRVETIPLGETLSIEEEKSFLNEAVRFFRSIKADVIIPPTTNTIFRTYPDGAVAAPYGTLIIDLQEAEDELWARVHSKHRNVIRNARKRGVRIISEGDYASTSYQLIQETFQRSALPFMSQNSFMRIVNGLGPSVRIFVAEWDGALQGCAVIPFSAHSAYYVYGGSIREPVTGAMNLLQWEAMLYFRGLGVERYDFCGVRINPEKGSKQAGLMMFKERFGPRLVRGFLWKRSLNPIKAPIYNFAVRLFRGGDIVDLEKRKLGQV